MVVFERVTGYRCRNSFPSQRIVLFRGGLDEESPVVVQQLMT
jgi:hypothetical protein